LMDDPLIRALHADGVEWRKRKIQALMTNSDMFYLFARIVQSPPTIALPKNMQQDLLQKLFTMRRAQIKS